MSVKPQKDRTKERKPAEIEFVIDQITNIISPSNLQSEKEAFGSYKAQRKEINEAMKILNDNLETIKQYNCKQGRPLKEKFSKLINDIEKLEKKYQNFETNHKKENRRNTTRHHTPHHQLFSKFTQSLHTTHPIRIPNILVN